jgi:hypothetical protein
MARGRRSTLSFSGNEARQALAVLIQEGKLAAGEVRNALLRRERLIRALRSSLAALEHGVGTLRRRISGPAKPTVARKAARRKPRISAATRKMYQAQGRYMAAVRQLPKEARAKVKAIREKSGVAAATKAAKKMAR